MWELLNTSAFAPFAIATLVLIILLVVELLGFFFGGISSFLDNFLPDALFDTDFNSNISMTADADISLGLKALDWLYVGRIPTMILLIVLIASFSISGFMIQQMAFAVLGNFISPWLASLDALVISFPLLKIIASVLYPILPKDESSVVSADSLVGRQARIILGYASIGQPAQAKLTDEYGQTHYVMVEPDPDCVSDNRTSSRVSLPITSDMNPPAITITAEDNLIITKKASGHYLVKKL